MVQPQAIPRLRQLHEQPQARMAEEPLQVSPAHCQPTETEQRNDGVFEPLPFGMIYYVAIDNWYTPGG